MRTIPSPDDIAYRDRFETGTVQPSTFGHREHLRLAYVYLCTNDTEEAHQKMQHSLRKFLKENGAPTSKYHATLTCSWMQAVKHFTVKAVATRSFDELIKADDRLLDTDIMLTHYRHETLFSERARLAFIPPDVQPIPQYA